MKSNSCKYKKWTISDIRKVLNQLDEDLSYSSKKVPIIFNNRLKNTLACFAFDYKGNNLIPLSFEFSNYIKDGFIPEDIVVDIIKHEYIHFYINTKFNKDYGHDSNFKYYCKKIGISGKADTLLPKAVSLAINKDRNIKPKYKITCTGCGNSFNRIRIYRGKEYYLKNYVCIKCNSKFKIEEI